MWIVTAWLESKRICKKIEQGKKITEEPIPAYLCNDYPSAENIVI